MNVGLGTRVAKANMFKVEATAKLASEQLLLRCVTTHIHANIIQHMSNCRRDDGVGMSIESRRELSGQICISL